MNPLITGTGTVYIPQPGDKFDYVPTTQNGFAMDVVIATHADGTHTRFENTDLDSFRPIIPAHPGFSVIEYYLTDAADPDSLVIHRHSIIAWHMLDTFPKPLCVDGCSDYLDMIEAPNGAVYVQASCEFEDIEAAKGFMLEQLADETREAG